MIPPDELYQRCCELSRQDLAALAESQRAQQAGPANSDLPPQPPLSRGETLIGFFQHFRPDGISRDAVDVMPLFDDFQIGQKDIGDAMRERLSQLYFVAGEDVRPAGGRDVYFIPRRNDPIPAVHAQQAGEHFVTCLNKLAAWLGADDLTPFLNPPPKTRILEGLPPKQPRRSDDQQPLLIALKGTAPRLTQSAALLNRIEPDLAEIIRLLQPAYYFTTCDPFVRDYLMWPLIWAGLNESDRARIDRDPFRSYFQLWSHGAKWRVFAKDQIDWYLPRQTEGNDGSGGDT